MAAGQRAERAPATTAPSTPRPRSLQAAGAARRTRAGGAGGRMYRGGSNLKVVGGCVCAVTVAVIRYTLQFLHVQYVVARPTPEIYLLLYSTGGVDALPPVLV